MNLTDCMDLSKIYVYVILWSVIYSITSNFHCLIFIIYLTLHVIIINSFQCLIKV